MRAWKLAAAALWMVCAIGTFAPGRAAALGAREAPIASVTVYEDRALVTRSFTLPLPKGLSSHDVAGLTSSLDTTSLRAMVDAGPTGLKVIGVTSRRDVGQPSDEEVRAARRRVEGIQDRIAAAEHRIAALDGIGRYIAGYAEHARKGLSVRTTEEVPGEGTKPWGDVLAFLAKEETERIASRRGIEREIENAREELSAATAELQKLESGAGRESTAAILAFDSPAEGEAKVSLAYLVHGARWRAAYDARYEEGKKDVEVDFLGVVHQSTGEAWEKVALTLSTARPSLGAKVPEIVPLQAALVAREEDKVRTLESAAKETEKQAGLMQEGAAPEEAPEVEARKRGPSLVFAVRAPATIPADGTDHQVLVTEAKLKADVSFETVPKLMELVYLKAELTNTLAHPLLSGEVRVTRAGSFIGVSHLDHVAPSETFPLFLGVDREIQVIRQVRRERSVKEALLGKGKTYAYGYTIRLRSSKSGEPSVRVREGIPLSEVKDVKVDLLPETTRGYEVDKDGILTWKLSLKKDEEAKLDLGYKVEVPGNFDWQ